MSIQRTNLPRLYIITDTSAILPEVGSVVDMIEQCLLAGAQMIQWRNKTLSPSRLWQLGYDLRALTHAFSAHLLINDRVDIALTLAADGVHRPSTGLPWHAIKYLLGTDSIIGASVHTVEQALDAQANGASFVVYSPIFPSPSKPDYGPALGLEALRALTCRLHIPVYALGGINLINCVDCIRAGAYGVAVMGEIMRSATPFETTKAFLDILEP